MARRRQPRETLLSAGVGMLFFGALLLWGPALLSRGSVFATAASEGLRSPGQLFLVLGTLLVGLDLLVRWWRRLRAEAKLPPQQTGNQPGPRGQQRARKGAEARVDAAGREPWLTPAAPAVATSPTAQRPASAAPNSNPLGPPPGPKPTTWSPAVFAAIEWRRFEALCEALFAQAGFDTRAQSHGADGGVDIWLQSRHAPGEPVIVQCKHWQGRPVPVSAVREFLGVMASHKLQRGTYATSSTFTREALAFAQANGINAQDGAGLLRLIAQRTPEQQAALLTVALDGEYWRPTCASCGVKMVERTRKASGERFWGCGGYPKCRGTQPMTQAAQARLAS